MISENDRKDVVTYRFVSMSTHISYRNDIRKWPSCAQEYRILGSDLSDRYIPIEPSNRGKEAYKHAFLVEGGGFCFTK